MYTDPITLADSAEANQNFTRVSSIPNGSDWVEDDASLTDRRSIAIRHSNAGASVAKGARPIRRHLFALTHDKYNATLGKTERAVLNVTLTVDPGASIDETDLLDLAAFAKNFLVVDANVQKLIRDET